MPVIHMPPGCRDWWLRGGCGRFLDRWNRLEAHTLG
jgi:hypothetical protein